MKKLLTLLALLCVVNVLAVAGLIGYLAATGRLDRAKWGTIVDLARHTGTPNGLREQVGDILEPKAGAATASAPATRGGGVQVVDVGALPASAEERIDYARQAMEQERLRLENEAQDLRNRQKLLEQVQAQVDAKLAKIEQESKAYQQAVTASTGKSIDDNFQKSLALYNELKPKQIKDLFATMPPDLVARYLQAMESDQAGKIIAEFQAPTERTFIKGVLEMIRTGGTNSASGAATAGASAAAAGT